MKKKKNTLFREHCFTRLEIRKENDVASALGDALENTPPVPIGTKWTVT